MVAKQNLEIGVQIPCRIRKPQPGVENDLVQLDSVCRCAESLEEFIQDKLPLASTMQI